MSAQYKTVATWAKTMRKRAGSHLKALREDSKQTQADVAHKMGWTYYTMVSQIERGLARVPPEDMSKYAEVLGVPADKLAAQLLYFYDPHVYHALFGGVHPLDKEMLPKEPNTNTNPRRQSGKQEASR